MENLHRKPEALWLRFVPTGKEGPRLGTMLGIVLGLLVALASVFAIIVIKKVDTVRSEMQNVVALLPELRAQIAAEDISACQATLSEIQESIAASSIAASGPAWSLSQSIPLVGQNFHAVSEIITSADDIAEGALVPLLGQFEAMDWESLTPKAGTVDVSKLQSAAPAIASASNYVSMSASRLEAIDSSNLFDEIRSPLDSLKVQIRDAADALSAADTAATLLPTMLGADSARHYLVLIQNNAEARATGGIPGALAVFTTNGGGISLGDQTSAASLGQFNPPLIVDKDQESLFSSRIGTYMQSVNLTPDFPTAASTAKHMWEQRHPDQVIDGVLALDPVVLAHLLDATGPVQLSDPAVLDLVIGTGLPSLLTDENVVPTLLSDVYREIEDPGLQDVYFASVAAEIFTGFTNGDGDPSRLLDALSRSVGEQRLLLWSAHDAEQRIISQTLLSGDVSGPSAGGATFGMYFNDGTGAKIDFHATRTVQLIQGCQVDGYREYTLRVSVSNNAPRDAHDALPEYVTGGGVFGVVPGNIRTNYVAYGPAQSFVRTAHQNGSSVPFSSGFHAQRPVGTVTVELAPGESADIEFTFLKVVQDSEPKLSVTPTVRPMSEVVLPLKKNADCH